MTTCIFQPGNEPRLKTVEKELSILFPDYKSHIIRRSISYYDTFDWRLYNDGFRLFMRGKRIYLESIHDPHLRLSAPIKNLPRHVAHIQSEPMREILRPIVEVRALMPVIKLKVDGIHLLLQDNQKKTIVHCMIERPAVEVKNEEVSIPTSLSLTPVKGYEKAFDRAQKWCREKGFNLIKSDLLTRSLQVAGKRPGDYSSRIQLKLDPALPAAQATQQILAQLLRNMQINESGFIDDIDIEFLHDFRVSVRRIRSLFGQLKNVFHPAVIKRARKDFSEIGRLTNKMRDIDVYLLREESYRLMLPPDMKKDITPFFNRLKEDRSNEHDKIKNYISGNLYKQIKQEWLKFSNEPLGIVASEQGKRPVYDYAQKIILKRYRKIITLGRTISPETSDTVLHRLRIECKKLRYLLEFFLSLFPKRKMNILIRHLKKLQDNLGVYNDLSIQQDRLRGYTTHLHTDRLRDSSIAIGVLIGSLFREYQQVRLEFSHCFTQFSSPDMMNLFDELFYVKSDDKK